MYTINICWVNIQYQFNDGYHYYTNRQLFCLSAFYILSNPEVIPSLLIWPTHWENTTVKKPTKTKKPPKTKQQQQKRKHHCHLLQKQKEKKKLIGKKDIWKFSTFSQCNFLFITQFWVFAGMIFHLCWIVNSFIDRNTNSGLKQQCYLPTTDIDTPNYWHKFNCSTNLKVISLKAMEYFL